MPSNHYPPSSIPTTTSSAAAAIRDNSLPLLAIVGKPNVGKSTLLNNLCGKRVAITDDKPGVTRDRKYYPADLFGWQCVAIDTAGWDTVASNSSESIHHKMLKQTMLAAEEATIILMMVDGKHGVSTLDSDFAAVIRKMGKPTVLVVNKSEGEIAVTSTDLFQLGLGNPVHISAAHSIGFDELYDRLVALTPQKDTGSSSSRRRRKETAQAAPIPTITISGRPNVGKSTLFNKLLGQERNIVDGEAGTTRDAIAAAWHLDTSATPSPEQEETLASADTDVNAKTPQLEIAANISEIELVDTAGMRKRGKVARGRNFEFSSVGQSIAAVRRADMVLLVMDAQSPLEKQDLSIAKMTVNEGKGLILLFNKIDTLSPKQLKNLQSTVGTTLFSLINEIVDPPVIYTSAIGHVDVNAITSAIQEIRNAWVKRLNTSLLNRWLEQVTKEHTPARGKANRVVKFKHINQVAAQPPTFQLFTNLSGSISTDYLNYLRERMARRFGLTGVPIRFVLKDNHNPYANSRRKERPAKKK